jgi:hypothetical protein
VCLGQKVLLLSADGFGRYLAGLHTIPEESPRPVVCDFVLVSQRFEFPGPQPGGGPEQLSQFAKKLVIQFA